MKLTKNEDGTITYKRNVVNRVWDDKMYLFPIPQSERMKTLICLKTQDGNRINVQ